MVGNKRARRQLKKKNANYFEVNFIPKFNANYNTFTFYFNKKKNPTLFLYLNNRLVTKPKLMYFPINSKFSVIEKLYKRTVALNRMIQHGL